MSSFDPNLTDSDLWEGRPEKIETPMPNEPEVTSQIANPAETEEQKYQRLYGAPQGTSTQAAPQTVVATLPPEVTYTLSNINNRLAAMEERQSAPPPKPQPTQAEVEAQQMEWVQKIRDQDFKGAQEVIVRETRRGMEQDLNNVRQAAYQDALTASQLHMEMDRYTNEVRVKNPDLAQFERYLQAPVAERVEVARRTGKVNNPQDFVREYKAAVDAEVANLRNLGFQFRAAGKDEALTRSREVVSSTPLSPQQLQSPQAGTSDGQPQVETQDDYFARRRADESRRRGLS
jgi:hypothetical protein